MLELTEAAKDFGVRPEEMAGHGAGDGVIADDKVEDGIFEAEGVEAFEVADVVDVGEIFMVVLPTVSGHGGYLRFCGALFIFGAMPARQGRSRATKDVMTAEMRG
ncbi:hypothetical protein ACWIG4_30280 [Streptomyces sp. NPDC002248]